MKQYSVHIYGEGNGKNPTEGDQFDTIDEIIEFASDMRLASHTICVTEWDIENVDGLDRPEIIEQNALEDLIYELNC